MNKYMKIICIALILAILSGGFEYVRATLGPIHVELNTTGDRPSGVRANSVTAFKIHIRFNINIRVHDWIKIWFPAKEASSNIEDICDGLPALNGKSEHPRFVPNEKYFEKYPGSEESKFGKMYEVMDDRKGNTKFYSGDCSEFEDESVKKNMIPDKSGLGHWLLGTIIPCLPKDEKERYHRLAMLIRYTSFGYTPCGECQGLPILKNLCNERLFQFNSSLEVDAWRKGYNPMDFNSSKATGIIAPATPGRYTLFVATAPEPTPVESEAFVLPCSQISSPKVIISTSEPDEKTAMTVKFNVGEGGALDKEYSKIYVKFPAEYNLPSSVNSKKAIITNNEVAFGEVSVDRVQKIVSFKTWANVDNNNEATITFTDEFGLTNPKTASKYQLEAWTDSEPEPIKSEPFEVGDLPMVVAKPDMEYSLAEYYMVGMVPKTWVKKGEEVTINFPKGTKIPDKISPSFVVVNKKPCTESIKIGENTITFVSPIETTGFLKVRILKDAKIKNPPAGEYEFTYTKNGTKNPFARFTFTKSMPSVEFVTLTNESGCEGSGYKIKYIPSMTGDLAPGDTITIGFPEGTVLPRSIDSKNVTVGGKESREVLVSEKTVVTIATNVKIMPETGAEIFISSEAGIINTRYPGSYMLTVTSSKDPPATSPQFLVLMPKLNSRLVFKEPSEPDGLEFEGCKWYRTPPILTFETCNPLAEITFWFDNKENAKIIYTGEKKMSPGSSRFVINYYSKVGDVKEEPKSVTICLDTIPPIFEVTEPAKDILVTNKPTYIIKGERQPTEMLTWGDNEKYQVVDGLFIDGTQIFSPEIFETLSRDAIKMKFEHKIDLTPGQNIVEIKGIDQAGNIRTVTKTIIYDNKKPDVEFVSPTPGAYLTAGDLIGVQIVTEDDAAVFIDSRIANFVEKKAPGKAIFEGDWEVVEGENAVPIEVTDSAGNITTTTLRFFGKKKQTVISLWLDKTTWTVNGVTQTPLKTAPTSSSPPLPKEFVGNTFMPISEVAKALGANILWDSKSKMVTLTQTLSNNKQNIVQLWIGNKTAKINGIATPIDPKGKLYPTLVNGKTVLPLRFVANSLHCSVVWEPKEKRIVLTYPAN